MYQDKLVQILMIDKKGKQYIGFYAVQIEFNK